MLVKICGIMSPEAALAAQIHGADCIGFVFAESKRKIDMAVAMEIAAMAEIVKIGVFANAPLDQVQTIARKLKLSYVQLHGSESAQYCQEVGFPVIKAFPHTEFRASVLNKFPAEWILLDTFSNGRFGGAGESFDWEMIRAERAQLTKPLMLAGGLDARNVEAAIRCLRPDGVDVSSGVETAGIKCVRKIKEFIAAARKGEQLYA